MIDATALSHLRTTTFHNGDVRVLQRALRHLLYPLLEDAVVVGEVELLLLGCVDVAVEAVAVTSDRGRFRRRLCSCR